MKKITILIPFIFLLACRKEPDRLFTLLSPEKSGVTFSNKVSENERENLIDYTYVYNGGGVAVGDINNDGLPDLYFTGNQVGDRIYLNKTKNRESVHFEDITENSGIKKYGWSTGVTMADVNADGLLDIYVSKSGNFPGAQRANQLYLNLGNSKFREAALEFGIADTSYTNQSAFFDFDKDGDLDLFMITSTNLERNPNKLVPPKADGSGLSADKLYENMGNGKFKDISANAGILHDGMSLGLSIADFNGDGWEDIFVGNDFLANDLLYLNNQNGTFTETSKESFAHHSQFSMGSDAADINNDGYTDLMSVDMLPADNEQRKKMAGPANFLQFQQSLGLGYHPQFMRNMLFSNQGNVLENGKSVPKFSEIGQFAGVSSTDWSWSPLFADFDNDGLQDLYITNGYLRDVTDLDFVAYNVSLAEKGVPANEIDKHMKDGAKKMATLKKANRFFKNKDGYKFEDIGASWTDEKPSLSNGSAYADLDNDGDLDLIVNNMNEPASIWLNNSKKFNYIKIALKGYAHNLFGFGTKVIVYSGQKVQERVQQSTKGFQSASIGSLHFGLGESGKVDSVVVIWPDAKFQVLKNVPANQQLTFSYTDAAGKYTAGNQSQSQFEEAARKFGIDFVHHEIPYMDFNQEPFLLHKMSTQGPKMAKGDINGDGLEDFFIGGAYHSSGTFFVQGKNGKFVAKSLIKNGLEKDEEDIGVVLFDIDNDKDLDLYIVSGSNEYFDNSPYYQDRLYRNDGKGNFTLDLMALPPIHHSGTCIAVGDFDQDGYQDVFRGGGVIALEYPRAASSHLFKNVKGKFVDVTSQAMTDVSKQGIVKDAIWTDIDNDKWPELVVVGEWMPVLIYKNVNGKLNNSNTFPESNGFWNCIEAADFDKDGDMDFVLGNRGKNSRYKSTKAQPLTIYGNDFDQNGKWDAIASYFLNDKEYPIVSRDELTRHIPVMKKKFQTYQLYAAAGIEWVLDKSQMDKSTVFKVYDCSSIYLENRGNGKFESSTLPDMVQWSTVQDILIDDLNADSNLDILLVGNDYGVEPVAGQYDASYGVLLLGNGRGKFDISENTRSGIWAGGDCRALLSVTGSKKEKLIMVSRNNLPLLVFNKRNAL